MKLIFLLLAVINTSLGSRILFVFPFPSKSHYILGRGLAEGLLKKGHDITFISSFTDKPPEGNGTFKYINIPDCMLELQKEKLKDFNYFKETVNPFLNLLLTNFFGETCTKVVFDKKNVKELLESNQHFDAVIIENLFSEGLGALAWHFNAPLIVLNPVGSVQWVNDIIGNPNPASYTPSFFLDFSENMTFWQKSQNYLFSAFVSLNQKFFYYPKQNEMVRQYFPDCPDLEEIWKDVALVLSNSHESINPPLPNVPNVINIGGFHINPSTNNLPADLQKILDDSKNGVIYFSLGSHVKPSHMDAEMKNTLIKVFSSLKQTVLWKWDDDSFPKVKPDNIIVKKWFPQQQILVHPNIKLFITHSGLLSLTEAIHIGVPILTMPVLGDQKYNSMRAEALGIGKPLGFSELTEEKFSSVINELLTNPKYIQNVKRLSQINRDRPNHPLDLAIYWIEYIIRYNGAPHLRVHGRNLTWFQYYCLDVVVVWSIVFLVPLVLMYKLFKKLFCNIKSKLKIKKL